MKSKKPSPRTGLFLWSHVAYVSPRAWFWTADDGKVYISLRYGTRVIEMAKGKSAIEVGDKRQLVPVIEALKQAVAAGELDNHIDTAGVEVSKRFLKVGRQ